MTIETASVPRVASLPAILADRTLGEYDPSISPSQRAAHDAALHFVEHGGRSLVLIGRPGAGKSHLAAGICNAVWSEAWIAYQQAVEAIDGLPIDHPDARMPALPPAPRWVNLPDLISRLRGFDDETRWEAREIGRHPGLVVLDDLGREKASEWTGAEVYNLVNLRYENRRRTVVTSNLTVAELDAAGYGPAISRLAEGGRLLEMASAVDMRTRKRGAA